jgi:hypothetical protein
MAYWSSRHSKYGIHLYYNKKAKTFMIWRLHDKEERGSLTSWIVTGIVPISPDMLKLTPSLLNPLCEEYLDTTCILETDYTPSLVPMIRAILKGVMLTNREADMLVSTLRTGKYLQSILNGEKADLLCLQAL